MLLGLAIGACVLTRGEAILLVPLLVVPLCWTARRLVTRERVLQGGLIVGVAVLLIAPWTTRNLLRFDTPVPLSSNSQEVLYAANCPDVYDGPLIGYWSFECQQRVVAEQGYPPGDEAERAAAWRRDGVRYALDHQDRWPAVALARVTRVWDLQHSESTITAMRFEGRDERWSRAGLWAYRLLARAGRRRGGRGRASPAPDLAAADDARHGHPHRADGLRRYTVPHSWRPRPRGARRIGPGRIDQQRTTSSRGDRAEHAAPAAGR